MDPLYSFFQNDCPVCSTPVVSRSPTDLRVDQYEIICPRCGTYLVSEAAADLLLEKKVTNRQRANLSGWLSENQGANVISARVPSLLLLRSPSPIVRAEKLLHWLAGQETEVGAEIKVTYSTPELLARTWSWSEAEVRYLLLDLLVLEVGAIVATDPNLTAGRTKFKIAPKGWELLDALSRGSSTSKLGFIAMWFDPSMDGLRDEALIPAVQDAGYEAKIISQHDHVNLIDDEIVALLRQSKFVVADFTGNRGGVYFEAGFARGLERPVIWTCRQSELVRTDEQRLHFDVNHFNFLPWEPDALPDFRRRLENRILAVVGPGPDRLS